MDANVSTPNNTCAICGSPGITMFETGKWLCTKHSPYTNIAYRPQYDLYLKQKSIELSKLMLGMISMIHEMEDMVSPCPYCNKKPHEKHCPMYTALELCKLKTEYHPLTFFSLLSKVNKNLELSYVQDKNIFGYPSVYEPEEYVELDQVTFNIRFWSKLITDVKDLTNLRWEAIMNLPNRIGYEHIERFTNLPVLNPLSDKHINQCQKCQGHGYWNIWTPCSSSRNLINRCRSCNGLGWLVPNEPIKSEFPMKNFYFDLETKTVTWSNARQSEIIGSWCLQARVSSKLSPAEFASRLSVFLGETISAAVLISIENGNSPLFESIYVGIGYVANCVLVSFKK
jgi:hypothetical protein